MITTQKQATAYCRRAIAHGSLSDALEVRIAAGETLSFPGLRWLYSLFVYVGNGAAVHFPDLCIVTGEIHITFSANGGEVILSALREVGENRVGVWHTSFDETINTNEEFSCLAMNAGSNVGGEVSLSNSFLGDQPENNTQRSDIVYLANDDKYSLSYDPEYGSFNAGCRHFFEIDEAIKHWKHAAVVASDEGHLRRANRAIMFVFALTNFKMALKMDVSAATKRLRK